VLELNFADMTLSPLMQALGLVIDGALGENGGCTQVRGHIDAGPEHHQPTGIVHGALYTGAIETAASVGAFLAVRDRGQSVVGVDNFCDFLRPHTQGRLEVDARAVSQGRTLQLWEVDITDDQQRLVAKGRVRLANRDPAGTPTKDGGR
jgi:1,4-dihydroxy-2-naphthoyl-CoA hydrolase